MNLSADDVSPEIPPPTTATNTAAYDTNATDSYTAKPADSTAATTAESSAASTAPSSAATSSPPSPRNLETTSSAPDSSVPSSSSAEPSSMMLSSFPTATSGSSTSSTPSSSSSGTSGSFTAFSGPSPLPTAGGNKTHPDISLTRKSSFLHRIKKSIWQGDRTINSDDPKFDVAVNNFKSLNDTFFRLRLHLNQYVGNLRGLMTTSNTIALDFVLGIDDQHTRQMTEDRQQQQQQQQQQSSNVSQHEYASILSDVRSTHKSANLDRTEQLSKLLERQAISPLDNALSEMVPINRDIEKRQQLRSEHDYYFKKLSTLQQDRVMKHDGSSQDSQSDKKKESKIERNQAKYEEVNQQYNLFSSNLLQRLVSFYNHRVSVLGPSLQIFLSVEKEISEMLHQNQISDQKMKEMEEKNAQQQEDVKQEERKGTQVLQKQNFAEHYFNSQQFLDDLNRAIEKRRNKINSLDSLHLIDQQLQQHTEKLVQDAAAEAPNLTATAFAHKRETKIPEEETQPIQGEVIEKEQEKGREKLEETGQQRTTADVLNLPAELQKSLPEQVKPSELPAPAASDTAATLAADSLSKDNGTGGKLSTEKEKIDFANEARSPAGSQPILDHSVAPLVMGPLERRDRASDSIPEKSPSVTEPMFHERDEHGAEVTNGSSSEKEAIENTESARSTTNDGKTESAQSRAMVS